MTRMLFGILGRRTFLTFGLVAFLVGALLATVNLTSRYALKQYVAYQLDRIPWDVALYQQGPSGGEDPLRAFVAGTPGVTEVATLAFLRARFPEAGEVQAKVDDAPFNTPWLSVLAASDLSLLPPQLSLALQLGGDESREGGAVLALMGPDYAIGKAVLALQGARSFALDITPHHGQRQRVFETPLRQVIRLERDELNRWLMDQTGSVSYVPVVGAILLMPYDWEVLTSFDFVAHGLVPGQLQGTFEGESIHVQQAEYAPELVYLARIDRDRLISGWDVEGSLARVAALNDRLQRGAPDARRASPPTPASDEEPVHAHETAGTAPPSQLGPPGASSDVFDAARAWLLVALLLGVPWLLGAWLGRATGRAALRRVASRRYASIAVLLILVLMSSATLHSHGENPTDEPEPEKFGTTTYVVDSTTEVLLDRMQEISRLVGVVSLLVALPLLWMAWVLGATLATLLSLNERRKLGLLRLRGVSGALMGRVLLTSVASGGFVGGLLGLAAGSIVTLMIYEGGGLPIDVLLDRRQLAIYAVFLLVTVAMALLVCRRFVRYATTISPLEATARVASSEPARGSRSAGALQVLALIVGSYVLLGWIFDVSISDRLRLEWFRPIDQLLNFLGLPLFVYGVATLMVSNQARVQRVMAPIMQPLGGALGRFALRHVAVKPHRTVAFLLIVALMSSVSLYPVITSGSFEDKAARGARVQIGADWQVMYSAPDLVPASDLNGSASRQLAAVGPAVEELLQSLRGVDGVTDATYMVEALLPNFYLPGYGLRGVPLYLIGDASAYASNVYSEPEVGVSSDFGTLFSRLDDGEVALSQAVADFWEIPPGKPLVIGMNEVREAISAKTAGVLAFLPGMPPKTVSDRRGFVQARVDYLNYLLATNAYLVGEADNPQLADMQIVIPRIVVLLRTQAGANPDALRADLASAGTAPPLEIHSFGEEVSKVGSDMYISLALANMRIYLLGGLLLALVAILAIAMANYVEDRRTLALLRIRGASPLSLWRFVLATLLSPTLLGLAIGGVAALVAGYGLATYVWQLREIRTVVQLLPTHLVIPPLTAGLVMLLMTLLIAVASGFSWWAFRDTAHQSMRGT